MQVSTWWEHFKDIFLTKHTFKSASTLLQHFMKPLERFLSPQDIDSIFSNIEVQKISSCSHVCTKFVYLCQRVYFFVLGFGQHPP